LETTIKKGTKVERRKIEEPNQAIIHMYMELPQENSLCNYLKHAKCYFFFLSFAKSENKREEQVLPGRLIKVGVVRRWGKGIKE
jgi:hypothetical protein